MEKQILQIQLTQGCGNRLCQNQHCVSSKFWAGNPQGLSLEQQAEEIYNKLGNMSICLPSIGQIACRWLNTQARTHTEAWSTAARPVDLKALSNVSHEHVLAQTDFSFLQSVISCNLSSLDQLEYFLCSEKEIERSVALNTQFVRLLLDLEQEDPALQKDDAIIEMTGQLTIFLQKLLDVLFNNTYLLSQVPDPKFLPSSQLLLALLALPEQFLQRSNISAVCTAALFCKLPKQGARVDFQQYFLSFIQKMENETEQFGFIDSLVSCCNQFISVTLSMYDKPRKSVSVLDILHQKKEFVQVVELMQFLYYTVSRLPPSVCERIQRQLQNEYVNSNAYNITPDTDFWLQQHPFQLSLDALPVPLQLMIRARQRRREFPPEMFTLLDFPFILNPGTKAQIFRYECSHNIPHIGKLVVSRQNIVNDTLSYISSQTTDWMGEKARALLRIPLKVEFQGEEGVDAGGLSNEFFTLVCDELFSPKYNLFCNGPLSLRYQQNNHSNQDQHMPGIIQTLLSESKQKFAFVFIKSSES